MAKYRDLGLAKPDDPLFSTPVFITSVMRCGQFSKQTKIEKVERSQNTSEENTCERKENK